MSLPRNKQKNQCDMNWLCAAGYSAIESDVIVRANKTAFIKKSHYRLIDNCQLERAEIVAVLKGFQGEKNLWSFMTHYHTLRRLGFSQHHLRFMLQSSSVHQSIEYIIKSSDRLFSAPLALSPDQIAAMVSWPEGHLNISTLLQYQAIVLNLGVADSLEYFTTCEQRDFFVEELAKVIIEDRLLYDEDFDGETTDESVSPVSFDSYSPMECDQPMHVYVSPCQPLSPRPISCATDYQTAIEPPFKRPRIGMELMAMDESDTQDVIDSFLGLFAIHDSVKYAANSLCNMLYDEKSKHIVYKVLNTWLLSNDSAMKDNVLKFICTLVLDVESENTSLKGYALQYMCELLEDERTKAPVMQSLREWLHSDEDYWQVLATETIQYLLATGQSVIPPANSSTIAVASMAQLSHNPVNNSVQGLKRPYQECLL